MSTKEQLPMPKLILTLITLLYLITWYTVTADKPEIGTGVSDHRSHALQGK